MDVTELEAWFGEGPGWAGDLDADRFENDLLTVGQLCDPDEDEDSAPLSVAETLALAGRLGPCLEAQRLLESLDEVVLSPDEQLTVVELLGPIRDRLSGRQLRAVVAWAGPVKPTPSSWAQTDSQPLELSLVAGVNEDFARRMLAKARALATTLSGTGDLLPSGAISDYHAHVVFERLSPLAPSLAAAVEATVLSALPTLTVAQLRRRISRAIKKLDAVAQASSTPRAQPGAG